MWALYNPTTWRGRGAVLGAIVPQEESMWEDVAEIVAAYGLLLRNPEDKVTPEKEGNVGKVQQWKKYSERNRQLPVEFKDYRG